MSRGNQPALQSGFRDLTQILARDHPDRTVRWPTWRDLEEGIPHDGAEIARVEAAISVQNRTAVRAAQAGGKTVAAKLIGYRFIKNNQDEAVVFYGAADHIDVDSAIAHIQSLEHHENVLFIIDDCHRATDEIEWFLQNVESAKHAKLLLTSRNVTPTFGNSGDSVFIDLFGHASAISLEVTLELVRQIVAAHCRKYQIDEASLTDDAVSTIRTSAGADLEVLRWLLEASNTDDHFLPESLLDMNRLYDAILRERLSKAEHRSILLPLAALQQLEIAVQERWFDNTQDALINDGIVEVQPTYPGSRGVFLELSHASLARLYLQTADHHDLFLESTEEYTFQRILDYLRIRPMNFFQVLNRLHQSEQNDLMARIIAHDDFEEIALKFVSETDVGLMSIPGLCKFVFSYNPKLGRRLMVVYLDARSPQEMLLDLLSMDDRARSRSVSHSMSVGLALPAALMKDLGVEQLREFIHSKKIFTEEAGKIFDLIGLMKFAGYDENDAADVFTALNLDAVCEWVSEASPRRAQKIVLLSRNFSDSDRFRIIDGIYSANREDMFDGSIPRNVFTSIMVTLVSIGHHDALKELLERTKFELYHLSPSTLRIMSTYLSANDIDKPSWLIDLASE